MDRAYFLGQLLRNLDAQIWENISKDKLRRKFAEIDIERSTKQIMYIRAPAILSRLVEKNFADEQESCDAQINMIETIEKIRTGQLPFVEDEEKKEEAKVEEVKEE